MTPAAIIEQAASDGVSLTVTPHGTIKVSGKDVVVERWRALLAANKLGVIALLTHLADGQKETDITDLTNSTAHGWPSGSRRFGVSEANIERRAPGTDAVPVYGQSGIEPPPRRSATVDEAAELRALIEAVLADAPEKWDEVFRIACADPESALISWRSLIVGVPPVVPPFPDPPTCRQCLNVWRCRKPPPIGYADSRSALTSPPYDPAIDVGLRCESYRPNAADPDQRPAWERWPDLLERS